MTQSIDKSLVKVQVVRYLLVAGLGYVFALLVYAACLWVGAGPYPSVVVAFVLNGLFNFVGFRVWVFPASGSRPQVELSKFIVVAVGSLIVNYTAFAVFFELANLPALIAQALAIAVAAPFGFLANRLWTFNGASAA